MNSEKQKTLIETLLSSPEAYTTCSPILEGKYFDVEYEKSVNFINKYYDEYHAVPSTDIVKAEGGVSFKQVDVDPDRLEYTIAEIEAYCKQKALELAVVASIEPVKAGDGGKVQELINEALLVSLNRNMGLRYFENPRERLERMLLDPPVIPTGIPSLDELLFGGYSRKELLLVSANSGGGKSITLSNLGFNALLQGFDVLYVSLELSEDIVAQRFDTMYTGISRKIWKGHVSEIVTGLRRVVEDKDMGILDIIQMKSGTSGNMIRTYLNKYYAINKKMPDVIVLDYVDKMAPNQRNVNLSDVWTKDKYCSEQLRDVGVDMNSAMLTASQLNRDAIKAGSHDHSHIAGGISKINECDIYWSIKMDDIMRAQGVCEFKLQKTRNSDGVGATVRLKWDPKHLRILEDGDNCEVLFAEKEEEESEDINTRDASNELKTNDLLDLLTR